METLNNNIETLETEPTKTELKTFNSKDIRKIYNEGLNLDKLFDKDEDDDDDYYY